jgi:hypothetical protein
MEIGTIHSLGNFFQVQFFIANSNNNCCSRGIFICDNKCRIGSFRFILYIFLTLSAISSFTSSYNKYQITINDWNKFSGLASWSTGDPRHS